MTHNPARPKKRRARSRPARTPRSYDPDDRSAHDEIVRGIAREIADGLWVTGPSHESWADRYGVSTDTVRRWAAEAARHLRLMQGDGAELRDRLIAGIERAQRLALEARKLVFEPKTRRWHSHSDPDVRSYLAAAELQGRFNGLLEKDAPKAGGQDVPVEEIVALLEESGYEIRKKGT